MAQDDALPSRLRAAADGLFLRGEDPEPYREILQRHPVPLLRSAAVRRDPRLLAAALRSGYFTPGQAEQVLRLEKDLPYPIRLLLQHPELAEPLTEPEGRPTKAVGDGGEGLRRSLFDAGVAYPLLRPALGEMKCLPDESVSDFGTDGLDLFFRPDRAGTITAADVQHMLIHCVFRHADAPEPVVPSVWDASCDIACEYLRAELFPYPSGGEARFLTEDALPSSVDPRSARSVYGALLVFSEEERAALHRRCRRDDHRFWYAPPRTEAIRPGQNDAAGDGRGGEEDRREALAARWRQNAEELLKKRKPSRRYGLSPGSREDKMILRQIGKYDFTRYLRRFSTLREEMQLDESSFDYIPYHYGLERYGNLPFLEPLEYTESFKVEQLVLAIDTSGSCSRETVERFLGEIERILMRRENFFRKMELHIMQCDAILQDDAEIRSLEDWKRYLARLRIKGRGGTDFNPVFDRVARLRSQGKLRKLRGLIYFTDGDGVYPRSRPPYETAFVFTDRSALERAFPDWIVPLCLDIAE